MHSHTSIQHLVKRAEELAQRRAKKDLRPAWLTQFIEETAELFEPETDAARVGFDCRHDAEQWRVLFYLGDAEFYGGMHDGQRKRIAFDFDLKQLLDRFEWVDSLRNCSLVQKETPNEESGTMIEITGQLTATFDNARIVVGILSRPPQEAGPGMRILPNGDLQPL